MPSDPYITGLTIICHWIPADPLITQLIIDPLKKNQLNAIYSMTYAACSVFSFGHYIAHVV